ncbi:MAG: hypothetical protein ACRD5G_16235, partial [Candidatus Acidiferrales bacterium]
MTIASAFKFRGGVLLCADTRFSTGTMRQHGKKILRFRIGDGPTESKIAFAISGNVDYARMAADKCVSVLTALPVGERNKIQAKSKIEEVLLSVYRDHVYPHPLFRAGTPDFELAIAIWNPSDGLGCFSTHESTVNEIEVYKCLGAGADLAEYLIHAH